ncbi:GNAT family N-acetyltransferase [Pseudoalteromonas xiamenensis]|uniref:GNAT family N-acetyltransferase n=1 Tax=Pseudoalteromonas xiamenensis TaxID=882626 RepID=UPI0027E4DF2F|nr:GNAT family N-acetyltransferase [Pseudoalteromonas xiamenensis]WMN60076.1 GNAT family N-acetyltransferase [Pseudoalteromonas xiamenensis]
MEIITEHLTLRPIKYKDVTYLHKILSQHSTQRFNDYEKGITSTELRAWIQWDIEQYLQKKGVRLAIIKDNEQLIGSIGIQFASRFDAFLVSFELDENYRGYHYMQEALSALQMYSKGIEWLRSKNWKAKIHVDNIAAINTVTNCGFHTYLRRLNNCYLIYSF